MSALLQPELPQPQVPASWSDRWFAWRNRLLASRVFQHRAASFVLTRPIAQRRAGELFDLMAGFVYSQVLLACVRLNVFDILEEGPQTVPVLARRMGLSEPAARRLLSAAHALRLAQRRSGDRFGLGVLGAPMVGNAALQALVEHHTALYADLADPVALLRGAPGAAKLASYWAYAGTTAPEDLPAEQIAAYTTLMSASQPLVAAEILDAYPMGGHRCLLDIGGGDGSFLAQAAARAPHLQVILFDLPAVADRARTRFDASPAAPRARVCGGDFLKDRLPSGADIATLVRVVHDHDDTSAGLLLRAAYEALAPGGVLLLAEPMAGTVGAQAMGDAYFGLYLFAMGSGQPRTPERLTAMLCAAGFDGVRMLPTRVPLQTRILVARKNAQAQVAD